MKSYKVGLLLSLIMLATLVIPTAASYLEPVYSAKGIVLSYYNPNDWLPPGVPSSVVRGGDWSLVIRNVETRKVNFKLHYYEMNIIPEYEGNAPFGSVDEFWITLVETTDVYFVDDDGWHVEGRFNVDKLAVQPDGSKIMNSNYLGDQWGGVIVRPNGLLQSDTGYWHLIGYRTYGTGNQQGNDNTQ